jgi:hypothetical protein
VTGTGRHHHHHHHHHVRSHDDDDDDDDDTPPVDLIGIWSFSGKWDERMTCGVLLPTARFSYCKAFCGSVESKTYQRKRRTTFHVRGNMWSLIMGSLNEENWWTLDIAMFRNGR